VHGGIFDATIAHDQLVEDRYGLLVAPRLA
jgi:hypothetical protein